MNRDILHAFLGKNLEVGGWQCSSFLASTNSPLILETTVKSLRSNMTTKRTNADIQPAFR